MNDEDLEKDTIDGLIHHRIKPLILTALTFVGGFKVWDKIVNKKRDKGFRTPLVQKLYDACETARKRMREEIIKDFGDERGKDWKLDMALAKGIMLTCIVADSERHWFPIGYNILLEELDKVGLLKKQPEPKKFKSKKRFDKHGNLIERTAVPDSSDSDNGYNWHIGSTPN